MHKLITELCRKAQEGELSLEDFQKKWPNEANKNSFYRIIYNDIEDGVEHFPGNWKKEKLYDKWYKSNLFLTLYLDSLLLESNLSEEDLIKHRDLMLKEKNLRKETIEDRVLQIRKQK